MAHGVAIQKSIALIGTTCLMALVGVVGCHFRESVDNAVATAKAESEKWLDAGGGLSFIF